MPVLPIAKLCHHTCTLLGILIGGAQLFRIQVVAQMNAEGKIAIGAVAQQLTEFLLDIYCGMIFYTEGYRHPFAIGCPGFKSKLS